jgi:hypothetical protein
MGLSLKRVTDPQYADLDWQAEFTGTQGPFEGEEKEDLDEESEFLYEEEVEEEDEA